MNQREVTNFVVILVKIVAIVNNSRAGTISLVIDGKLMNNNN